MKVYTKIFLLLLSVMITTKVSWAQTTTNPNLGSENFVSVVNEKTDLNTSFNSKGVNETGDDCSDPIIADVEIGTPYSDLDQYTCGRGNNYENSSYYEAGEEAVYKVNLLESMDLHIAVDPKGTNRVSFQLYSDCPDLGSLIKRKTSWSGTPIEHNQPLVAGTYYITVDVTADPGCADNFDLVLTGSTVPEGDACFSAYNYGNVNDAPQNGNLATGTDVDWYAFTAPVDMITTVSLCGSAANTRLEIWADCDDADYLFYNNNSCGSQSVVEDMMMSAGETYYAKVFCWSWGTGDYTLDISGLDATPRLDVQPEILDLGEWPIGGWQEAAYLNLVNDGNVPVSVTASDLDDPENYFALNAHTIPLEIAASETYLLGVSFMGEELPEAIYNTTYVASYGGSKSIATADIHVNAYEAVEGDIFENPFEVTIPHIEAGVSTAFPMRSNYHIPGADQNGNDVVYHFSLDEDQVVNVDILNATESPKMALYAANFDENSGPMVSNALFSGQNDLTDLTLFEGAYYLVVSSETDDAEMTFDIEITSTTMPAPECVVNPTPTNGALDIPSNSIVLNWEYANYVQEYQLLFGTDYPPTEVLMDWTMASEGSDSYALADLNPSMQYFWTINVRNNNATVECETFGFTTTLTPPTDLTAEIVEIAEDEYNVELNWNSSQKALINYNIYRNAELLATTQAGVTSYTDLDVAYNMDPCYEYAVEAIFDEGVSELSNIETVCITGVGTIEGNITALQTGLAIEGAFISIVSETGGRTYNITSDENGFYSAQVLEDCYTITAAATGYISGIAENSCVDYNTTETFDFELDEFPYPVSDVVATELSDSKVHIQWGETAANVSEWMYYDNGENLNAISAEENFSWAIKFNPSQMAEMENANITKFAFYAVNENAIIIRVLQGDNAETQLYSLFVAEVEAGAWNEISLYSPVGFDHEQPLWISGYTEYPEEFPAAYGPNMEEPNGNYISMDGTSWNHLTDFGIYGTWNLRAFVTTADGKSMSMNNAIIPEYSREPKYEFTIGEPNPNSSLTQFRPSALKSTKEILGYNVYRQLCDESAPAEFIGMTIDSEFTDNTWGITDWGAYKWAVDVIYTNNISELSYSNCLDKDMITSVSMEVATNSGDAPEGCQVFFTNISEPEMELEYVVELGESGVESIDPFRKGTYDILVYLLGYDKIKITDVLIDSDTNFVWQLEEILAQPANLYVTPAGLGTWERGYSMPFETFFEDFEGGELPEGWQATAIDEPGWFITLDGSSWWSIPDFGGYYACANDDANNNNSSMDYLITPMLDFSNNLNPVLSFSSYFTASYNQIATVEVSLDGTTWEVVESLVGSWNIEDIVVELPDYAGESNVWIAFHSSDNNGWGSGWAVDNVLVTDGTGKSGSKDLQFYKVFHDGIFIFDTNDTTYQYGENEEIIPGETYIAEVFSVYSNGVSEPATYEWTYLPCDSFPSWEIFDAYHIEGTSNNVVNWQNEIAFTSVEADFETGLPEGWTMTTNSFQGWFFSPMGSSIGWGIPLGDGTYAVTNDNLSGDDGSEDYLITPEMSFEGLIGVNLYFSNYFTGHYGQSATVKVSLDGGASWIAVQEMSESMSWVDVNIDLSAYAGEESVMVAFHSDDNGGSGSGWAIDNVLISPSYAGAIGTNIYRNGELVAYVAEPDSFFLDENLQPGYYDYCVAKVYSDNGGVNSWTSCPDGACVLDILIPETCVAPTNLTAEDLTGDGHTATLNWDAPVLFEGEWMQYDDGVNIDAVGLTNGGEMEVAVKWDPDQLVGYEGTKISKLKFFAGDFPSVAWSLRVYQGDNGDLIYEQPLDASEIAFGDWNEIMLDTPVDIDVTQSIWVGYQVIHFGGEYPAGNGEAVDHTNSDLVKFSSGGDWDHLQNYISGSWNLAAYVEASKGEFIKLPVLEEGGIAETKQTEGLIQTSGNIESNIDPLFQSKALLSYNIYRDGSLVAENVTETTYADEVGEAGYFCYEVTAMYSVCGESEATEEACIDVSVGLNNMENKLNVYPNPAKDFIMIESSQDIRSIEITNYMGQVVSAVKSVETTQYHMNTTNLSVGIYFVEVETASGIEKVRIIISK